MTFFRLNKNFHKIFHAVENKFCIIAINQYITNNIISKRLFVIYFRFTIYFSVSDISVMQILGV